MTYNGDYRLGLAVMHRPESVSEQIRLFKKVGWDGIFTGWNKDMTAEWAKVAREEGMEYQSIHSPFIGVNNLWLGNEEGDRLCASLIECVRDCARHDIPIMVIHPYIGFNFDQYIPTDAGLESFGKIIAEAERLGVRLGFENVEGEPFLEAIMKTFHSSPALGFCLDTGHELCYNLGKDMLALYGDKLCHTHFNDNMGSLGEVITHLDDYHYTMGDGIVDWKGVMTRIRKTGYSGILMCELTQSARPGLEPLIRYSKMSTEEFATFALERAREIVKL